MTSGREAGVVHMLNSATWTLSFAETDHAAPPHRLLQRASGSKPVAAKPAAAKR